MNGKTGLLIFLIAIASIGCRQYDNGVNRYSSRPLIDLSQRPAWLGGNQVADNRSTNDRFSLAGFNSGGNNEVQYAEEARRMASQYDDLSHRMGAFDNDNQLLNTELASLQQRLDMANQYNHQLKEQLAGTTTQMSQVFAEREQAFQQVSSLRMQLEQTGQNLQMAQNQYQQLQQSAVRQVNSSGSTPTQLAGGATLRANNSLLQKLSAIELRGAEARMDGDVIRIEIPSDSTFVPGTYQIQPAQMPLLQNIAGTIRQNFPRQIIGIEAHWDGSQLSSEITDHQLTATQSLAIFNEMTRLGLSRNQLFTMAMASNRPRHSGGAPGGISPNRRIEIVIYPEMYDGN